MKTNRRPYRVVALLVATLILAGSPVLADVGASARTVRVNAVVEAHSVRIEAKAAVPFEYATYRPSENLFVVDLAGVTAAAPAGARMVKSEIVSSYRVLQYRAGDRAIVRVEILMRTPVEPQVRRDGENALAVTFQKAAGVAPALVPAKATVAESSKVPGRATPATFIERIAIARKSEQTQVVVQGNGRLSYEVLRLAGPDRLVLDFAGARPRVAKALPLVLEPVTGVRVGQFKPGVTRVVIDLAKATAYTVTPLEDSLAVAFSAPTPAAVPSLATVAAPTARVPELPAKETATRTTTAQAAPAPKAAEKAPQPVAAKSEVVTASLALPPSLTQQAAALAAPAKAEPDPPAPAAATATPAPKAAPVAQGKYSGEPISVNLKDVDLKDFFRLIHEISGLNVVVDPQVRGSLTIVLDDVPWDQALDIVLKNNNLDKQLEGNVLRIATRDTLKKEAEIQRDLAKAQAEAVDQVVHTVVLSYAKASLLRDTLKRFLSSRGEILADERSNTLIIRDIPSVFPDLDGLIRQLDKRTQQVEIEGRVVSATRTFARDIGTQFGFATTSTSGRSVYGGLVGNGAFVSPVTRGMALPPPPLVSSGTSQIPLNTNLGVNAPTSGASFAHASPNFALDFIISAMESKGAGKLLSKPKVITQNNEKATIKQGTKIPIQTVVNNTISTQFIDAVLKMEVTPQITADGTIFMEVLVENTAIDDGIPRVQGIPALRTQSAETKVLIGDGGTVVIGGVIISSQRTDVAQVPLLGSIPIIGHLFKRTSVSTSSQELLFFLTPRIIPS